MKRIHTLLLVAIALDIAFVCALTLTEWYHPYLGLRGSFGLAMMGYYLFAPLYLAFMVIEFHQLPGGGLISCTLTKFKHCSNL